MRGVYYTVHNAQVSKQSIAKYSFLVLPSPTDASECLRSKSEYYPILSNLPSRGASTVQLYHS
jgi:hypothetical protein